MNEEIKSEFGKGFIYNLILFAKHWLMFEQTLKKLEEKDSFFGYDFGYDIWFNAASDHFYELEIPEQFKNTEIEKLALEIKNISLHLGHGFKQKATREDYQKIFENIEKLGMLIDKELGIEPIEATWK